MSSTLPKKVLIIEDSVAEAQALALMLRNEYDFDSLIAHNLEEAKTALQKPEEFSSAIVDLHLPECEMGDAFRLTSSHELPSVVFTGQYSTDLREELTSNYLVDLVLKSNEHNFKYVCWLINRIYRNHFMTALIIEDSRNARMTLTTILKHQGFQILEADSGNAALAHMDKDPDILIMDLFLPDILGYELCRKIRDRYKSEHRQIIGVSSKNDESSSVLLLKNGCDDFIARPFNIEEFTYRINQRAQHIDDLRNIEQLNKAKDWFMGMAAHDIRNPAAAITHAVKRLNSANIEDANALKAIDIINRSCDSMHTLLNDLLDYSTIESGQMTLNKQNINLCTLIEERINLQTDKAKEKQIGIQQALPDSAMIEADPLRIGQVIDNLLSNAIKYSPMSSSVTVSVEKETETVRISVSDQGPGIKEKDISSLFKAFSRLGHHTTGGESSHGLGLSICMQIVNAHNGHIGYKDAPQGGSQFYFELPKD